LRAAVIERLAAVLAPHAGDAPAFQQLIQLILDRGRIPRQLGWQLFQMAANSRSMTKPYWG
jgi:hypothetical protein